MSSQVNGQSVSLVLRGIKDALSHQQVSSFKQGVIKIRYLSLDFF